MTPTDEEIAAVVAILDREWRKVADMLLALKARAEAADHYKAKAEAAEKALREIAEFTSPLHEAGAIARAALEAKP